MHMLKKLEDQKEDVPHDTELVVHMHDNGESLSYGYYMASWENRCIFWLEEVEYDLVTQEVRVCTSESHIGE